MLLPLVVLRRDGYVTLSPVPAQAWKWLPVWVPTGGGSSCYRQANACNSTHERESEETGSLTRVCSGSTGEE